MKKSKTNEVLVVDAEEMIPEIELEKTINTELTKANVTDQVIAALKEKYGSLKLKSVDDKESYLELKASKREVAKVRILAEKITKRGRESAIKIQRLWLAKEKEVVGKIDEVESHLANEIKKFDDEVERKENEERIKREEAFIARQASLLKYGAEYKNGNYELGEISYETELIKNSDSEVWDEVILPKYKKVYEQKEAARVAEETKRREEMERQDKERKELEEKQAAFRKEQEEFERQKLEMQRQKEESERIIREAEINKRQEELRKKVALRNDRVKELKELGCYYDAADEMYYFRDLGIILDVISGAEIESLPEKEWAELVIKKKPLIEKIKIEAEEKRLAQVAKEKKEVEELAAQKERERIVEEERLAAIKKAEEMEQASDKEKYQDVVGYLINTPIHEMKSATYKRKMNIIKDFIADLKEN